jgi:hypothetical protein
MRIWGAAIVACVLLALAPTAHAGRWTESRTVESPDPPFGPTIAVNSRGDAVLAWSGPATVWVALAHRGGEFARPQALPASPGSDLEVDIDDRGNAIVGWTYSDGTVPEEPELREEGCCIRLAGAVKPAGRSAFGPVRTMSPGGQDIALWDLAAGPDGGGFLWSLGIPEIGDDLHTAFGTSRGAVGKDRRIMQAGRGYFESASILIRRGGTASLAVSRDDGALFERVRTRGGRFGATRTIARLRGSDSLRGRWLFGADREFAAIGYFDPERWSRRAPGGTFRTIRDVSSRGADGMDVAPDGSALALAETGEAPSLWATGLGPSGTRFSTPKRIAKHSRWASLDIVPVAANRGRGMAVWQASPETGAGRVYARRLLRGVPVGATRRMGGSSAHSPTAGASASGRTYVVWAEGGRITYARYVP